MLTLKYYLTIAFISQSILINEINAQISNICKVYKVQNPNVVPQQVIFYFQCYSPAPSNQVFPIGAGSLGSIPSEYTQFIMSPNTFTTLPTTNICSFTSVYLLDISYNQLTSITGLFQTLKCLVSLTTLVASNNRISTALSQSDFDDTFAEQLISIDLSNNQIPLIDSNLFFKSDGTSRFRNLNYFNLGYNHIIQFDILLPLTIPTSILNFLVNSNTIYTLVNQLNVPYTDSRFAYPAVGNRVINITSNVLTTFSDSNLLQYGLNNETDLKIFLNKIANYDLRQASNNTGVKCACSGSTDVIPTWYRSLLSTASINLSDNINKFNCSTYNQNVFLVVTTCGVSYFLFLCILKPEYFIFLLR